MLWSSDTEGVGDFEPRSCGAVLMGRLVAPSRRPLASRRLVRNPETCPPRWAQRVLRPASGVQGGYSTLSSIPQSGLGDADGRQNLLQVRAKGMLGPKPAVRPWPISPTALVDPTTICWSYLNQVNTWFS